MKKNNIKEQEKSSREIIDILKNISKNAEPSPHFSARVLARAKEMPTPRRGILCRLENVLWLSIQNTRIRIAFCAFFLIAIIGAIPQYISWFKIYNSEKGISMLAENISQDKLWERNWTCFKNFDPNSEYYIALVNDYSAITLLTCPSGDIMLNVEPQDSGVPPHSFWIPMGKESSEFSIKDLIIPEAYADNIKRNTIIAATPIVNILCQKRLSRNTIKRRVKYADGRCLDEVIDTRTGKIVERYEISCDLGCKNF